jgi:hypothetical protein
MTVEEFEEKLPGLDGYRACHTADVFHPQTHSGSAPLMVV